ncbi:cyclodeaminase/cyclohydrolase family protein [Ruminococcaceae bacterium OttesenSCG-928-O06]|nr:cyclodeaminase/cyclohydrolase family protein [Ruminococcaceae bacterium OttesenSCG-928-O06]
MDFTKQSCEAFVEALASSAPVPGGGGAAALVGAVGAALGNMVASLTVGKQKYAAVQEDILALQEKTTALQAELLAMVQRDAEAFEPLSRAYGLPAGTDAEKAEKARVMEDALRRAATAPLEVMQACCRAIALHREYAQKGAAIAISDVGVGVACCRAALQGASLNVFINTKAMKDTAYAAGLNREAEALLAEYVPLADEIFADVAARFALA